MPDESILIGETGLWRVSCNYPNPTDFDRPWVEETLFYACTFGLYSHYMLEKCKPDGDCWSPGYCSKGRKLWDQEMEYRKTWNAQT